MRGLRKYLTPFAPDQSGAVSVLYELGGIIVICDAGYHSRCLRQSFRIFLGKNAEFSNGRILFQNNFSLPIRKNFQRCALLNSQRPADFLWDYHSS